MSERPSIRTGHPVFAAVYSWMAGAMEAGPVGASRRALVADAYGIIVDLGAGAGANLPHFGDAVTRAHLIEPDPHMIHRMGSDLPDHVQVHQVGAEHLPLDDDSVDTVLATLTLCTVDDLPASLAEIRRVLRPGGQLLILEHVRSDNALVGFCQDALHGPWRWVGAGCHSNRDTAAALATAGFDTTALTRFTVPGLGIVREWLTGRLVPN
jgi:ubiquinone/menaquinone biosynthesis C-methylase UbiE